MTRYPWGTTALISTRKGSLALPALLIAAVLTVSSAVAAADGLPRTPAPEGAGVYLIGLEDGQKLTSPFVVRFGLTGMGVAPAGTERPATGHHHLLIDVELADPTLPIPADDRHRHFGGGQTEVLIDLPPGEHTLQLLVGDHLHIPLDPLVVSERITVIVE
jgi:hypothetical protein